MIGVVIDGRMGNQMFQYAFVYNYSKIFRTNFLIHQKLWVFPFILPKYFELPSYSRYLNSMKTRLYNLILKNKYLKIDYRGNFETPYYIKQKLTNNSYYTGYFQSYNYFEENKHSLLKEFKIKKEFVMPFEHKYSKLFNENKTIAVHLRRTDYVDFGDDSYGGKNLTLPLSYYVNCFNQIKDINSYKILFVSDDFEFIKQNFGEKPNYYFERNDEITDFQIIMNADIAIIANSSFSWWAGYLNSKPNKKIYAPKYWLGFKVNKELPPDLIPDDWNKIEVY